MTDSTIQSCSLRRQAHIVQSVRGHRVCSTKQLEEVMSIKVVANESKYSHPNICFDPVPLLQRFALVCFAREAKWHKHKWSSCGHTKSQVTPFIPALYTKHVVASCFRHCTTSSPSNCMEHTSYILRGTITHRSADIHTGLYARKNSSHHLLLGLAASQPLPAGTRPAFDASCRCPTWKNRAKRRLLLCIVLALLADTAYSIGGLGRR